METQKDLRLAVLIDADNVPYSKVRLMLEEIAKYGTPTFKRIYADWTRPNASGWKNVLLEHAITPIQQYSYTTGKNSSDSALIIDAMDILYSGKVDGYCIISSDSDFTRLATRLREAGMKVFGLGEKKTPLPFISACDKFIYLEILKSEDEFTKEENPKKPVRKSTKKSKTLPKLAAPPVPVPEPNPEQAQEPIRKISKETIKLIADSINDLADENGWVYLGDLGTLLLKKQPDFDSRNFGFKKLYPLIKSLRRFEAEERSTGKGNMFHVYVRTR